MNSIINQHQNNFHPHQEDLLNHSSLTASSLLGGNETIVSSHLKGLLKTFETSSVDVTQLTGEHTMSNILPPMPEDVYADAYPGTPQMYSHSPIIAATANSGKATNATSTPLLAANVSDLHYGTHGVGFMQMISPEMMMGMPPLTPGSVIGGSPPMTMHTLDAAAAAAMHHVASVNDFVSPQMNFGYAMNPLGIHLVGSTTTHSKSLTSSPSLKTTKPNTSVHFIEHSFSHSNPKRPIARSASQLSFASDFSNNTSNNGSSSQATLECQHPGCTKKFSKAANLRAHILTHAKERQYECKECGSRFRRLPDLQRHHRSLHTNSKPFVCPQNCGKSFARKDALKRHLECKSEGVPCAGFRRT